MIPQTRVFVGTLGFCILLGGSLPLVVNAAKAADPPTSLAVTKTCPNTAIQGDTVTCTIQIQNLDPLHSVTSLTVMNQVPFPGGPITNVTGCATTLAPNGQLGDTTSCDVDETLNEACPAGGSIIVNDRVTVTGINSGVQVPGEGGNAITVTCNTPTPTLSPSATGTPTDTATVTNTPTVTDTPTVTPTPTNTPPVHISGLSVVKSCPSSAQQGQTVKCTITVTNLGQSALNSLTVTNQVPFPNGPIQNVTGCASSLAASGQPGDSTSCSVDETFNGPCPPGGTVPVNDLAMAEGTDVSTGGLVPGEGIGTVLVICKAATPVVGWPGLGVTMILLVAFGAWHQHRAATKKR